MDGLKQRIIGAVVLVALAVIFIPMLFEEPHQQKTTKILEIPEKPEVPAFTIEIPDPADAGMQSIDGMSESTDIADTNANPSPVENFSTTSKPVDSDSAISRQNVKAAEESVSSSHSITQSTPVDKEPVGSARNNATAAIDQGKIAVQEQASSAAWVVQIGTFRNRPGAQKIRDELRESGTPSYLMDIVSGGTPMVRVYAGPTTTRELAERLKVKVDQRYNLQSLVVTYKGKEG